MKRVLLLLLTLLLLLSGCAVPSENADFAAVPDLTVTVKPTPFDFTRETEPEQAVDIVYKVATDYSQYAPKESATPLYSRLREEWIEELEPSENYGTIYPFAGSAVYSSYGILGYQYGMIDESGRIIADPTYVDISLLRAGYLFDFSSTGYLPMWVLERNAPTEEGYAQEVYALASLDGSFVSECKYSSVSGSENYAIATEQAADGSLRFDMYDLEGKLILRSEELPCLRGLELTWGQVYYSDGMFRFFCYSEDWDSSYYYTDLSGRTLLGPYDYGENFLDGYAMVQSGQERYTLIDTRGNPLEGMEFSWAGHFQNGAAVVTLANNQHKLLISTTGEILMDFGTSDNSGYGSYSFQHAQGNSFTYYDAEGNVLYGGPVPNDWEELGGGMFEAGSELINIATGERFSLAAYPSDSYVVSFLDYGLPYFLIHWWDYNGGNFYSVVSADFEVLVDEVRLGDSGYAYAATDYLSGRSFLHACGSTSYALYGEDASVPLLTLPVERSTHVALYNNRLMYVDEGFCAYYDLAGNLLFCYPLTSIGED